MMSQKVDRYPGGGWICTGCRKTFKKQRDGHKHVVLGRCSQQDEPSPSPNVNEALDGGGGLDGIDPWDGDGDGEFGDGGVYRCEDEAGSGEESYAHMLQLLLYRYVCSHFFFFFETMSSSVFWGHTTTAAVFVVITYAATTFILLEEGCSRP